MNDPFRATSFLVSTPDEWYAGDEPEQPGPVERVVPQRHLEEAILLVELGDEVADDDEVEGEERAAADVDHLQPGERVQVQLVQARLEHASHEKHLLLQA